MKVGQQVTIDDHFGAVVCEVREDGSFYTVRGDNNRERFEAGDPRVKLMWSVPGNPDESVTMIRTQSFRVFVRTPHGGWVAEALAGDRRATARSFTSVLVDEGKVYDITPPPAVPFVKLKWTLKLNTDELTIWASRTDEYECHGKGRPYGSGIRRDWTLKFKGRDIPGGGSRLSEAKTQADWHFNARRGFRG